MQLKSIHTFLVNPEKHAEEQSKIPFLVYKERSGKLYKLLSEIFLRSPTECTCEIIFKKDNTGKQSNETRDDILKFLRSRSAENGVALASRLQKVTTHRSGQGLMFIIYGEEPGRKKRIVISRFPADVGILADLSKGNLDIEFVDKLFMKSSKAYKAVCYEGATESDFWEGKAIDKQLGSSQLEVSDYWVKDFLGSDFNVTSARGSARLADAIKKVINRSDDLKMKHKMASSMSLAEEINGKVGNVRTLLTKLNVDKQYQDLVVKELGEPIASESFKFSSSELFRFLSYKTIELNNGAFITAPTEKFEEIIKIKELVNKTSFYTEGKVVDERLKKI